MSVTQQPPHLLNFSAMKSTALFSVFPPSFLHPKHNLTNKSTALFPLTHKTFHHPTHLQCNKMFVPGFGEASPEAKAASNLHHFFTYVAVKIVAAQLESYNPEAHQELMEFVGRNSLADGDKFCADLMRESSRHQNLVVVDKWTSHVDCGAALRILEVRSAYCKRDFEWDNLKRVAVKMVEDSNTKLMRDYVMETSHET